MMDMYNTVIQSISRLYLPYLLPLGAGVLLGIILTTKLLERAMEKHPQQTYLLILGFVLGSLPELFPASLFPSRNGLCAFFHLPWAAERSGCSPHRRRDHFRKTFRKIFCESKVK